MRQNKRLFSTRRKRHSYESQGIGLRTILRLVKLLLEGRRERKKAVEALEKAKEFISRDA
jgi:hypothetical protein